MKDRVYIHRAGPWYSLFMNRENETALASIADVSSEGGKEDSVGVGRTCAPDERVAKLILSKWIRC